MSETIKLPSQDEMLRVVGKGIQAFASVELGITHVFASIMEPADRLVSIVALDAVRHIESKIRVISAVADYGLAEELRATCRGLLNRTKKRSDFRHKLAHWTVSYWPGAKNHEEAKKFEVALVPPPASVSHAATIWGKESPIHLAQIEEFNGKCHELCTELLQLSTAISESKGS